MRLSLGMRSDTVRVPRFGATAWIGVLVALGPLAGCGLATDAENNASVRPENGPTMCPGERIPEGTAAVPSVVFATPIGSVQGDALQEGPAADGRRFAKQGLWVRSDVRARLVAQGSAGVDFQGWGEDRIRSVVELGPIPSDCVSWRVYPGGFVFRDSQCATILVTAGEHEGTLRFGLGTAC